MLKDNERHERYAHTYMLPTHEYAHADIDPGTKAHYVAFYFLF